MSKSSLSSWSSSWSEQQQQDQLSTNNYSSMSKRPITGARQYNNHSNNLDKIVANKTYKTQYFPSQPTTESMSYYSRKVFVGGLPPDIDESIITILTLLLSYLILTNDMIIYEIMCHFRRFGQLLVDWPHKNEINTSFPHKGYAFLIFEKESSVHELINYCSIDKDKFYLSISSSSMKDKPVGIVIF